MKKILSLLLTLTLLLSLSIPAFAANAETVSVQSTAVLVDGKSVSLASVSIDGETLVRLRDVAFALSGTAKQFDVQWDNTAKAVNLLSGKPYTVTGGELEVTSLGSKAYSFSGSPLYLDGRRIDLPLYTVSQTNYACLEDLSHLFDLHVNGFSIDTKAKHGEAIDYSKAGHWARLDKTPDKPVDVFFIYPTVWGSPDPVNQWFAPIDAQTMIAGAQTFIYRTIGAFEDCNVFAPYYRQADATVGLTMTTQERDVLGRQSAKDAIAAFDYYIKNLNHGRPFVLAGHSQGSAMLTYLMADYFKEHPEVSQRMVAAYPIGISITESYLDANPHLKFAESAEDTGVIISWNTQADPAVMPELVNPMIDPRAISINPINWKRDGTYAAASENLGSQLQNPDGSWRKVMNYADAMVDIKACALICKSIKPENHRIPLAVFPLGSYHGGDYDLYYYSVQKNVKDRIAAYMAAQTQLKLSDLDYANPDYWHTFGDKGKAVDIFAVYPTLGQCTEADGTPYVNIDSAQMRESAQAWLTNHAGFVLDVGNVYAPLYRQLSITKLAALNSTEFEEYTYAQPRDDVFAAFDYFLTHINKNERPFILIGHSQGAAQVAECATRMLGNEKYRQYNKNHIATYAIGYSVTQAKIALNPDLHFGSSKDDTHVLLSWNTTAPSEIKSGAYQKFGTWHPEALTTNPISWTTIETDAPIRENLPSKVLQPDGSYKMIEHYAAAIVDNVSKVLVAAEPDESLYAAPPIALGKYHGQDMLFYYESIRQNMKDRIAAFVEK